MTTSNAPMYIRDVMVMGHSNKAIRDFGTFLMNTGEPVDLGNDATRYGMAVPAPDARMLFVLRYSNQPKHVADSQMEKRDRIYHGWIVIDLWDNGNTEVRYPLGMCPEDVLVGRTSEYQRLWNDLHASNN